MPSVPVLFRQYPYGYYFTLLASTEQALPPRYGILKPLYYEGVFTLTTAPGLELLVAIRPGATTAGTSGPYLPRRILIHLLPVIVIPPRATGHHNLRAKIVLSRCGSTKFSFLKHCIDISRLTCKTLILCFYPIISRCTRQIQHHLDTAL